MSKKKIPEKAYEKVKVSIEKLKGVRYFLDDLSSSFYDVGNEKICDELFKLSSTIRLVIGYLELSTSQIVDEGYKQAVQNTTNIVNAALAGVKIEKDK